MSSDEKQMSLAGHRLVQAEQSMEEARYLMEGGKSLRSVVNRIYYGMFYAVLALLIYEPYSSSKHTGVLSYFNRNFVKSGIFPESLGRYLNKAFELRQRGDYREYFELTEEQVDLLLGEAKEFINAIKAHLNDKGKA
jgi:uncharacterized protein (UPF0332 family)